MRPTHRRTIRATVRGLTAVLAMTACLGALQGCRSTSQARDVEFSGFLSDYSQLQRHPDEGALYFYSKPSEALRKYTKVMFEPVEIRATPDSKLGKAPKQDVQAIVNYMAARAKELFQKDFPIVHEPGPDVMRVRCALTDMGSKRVVMSTISTVTPVGLALQSLEMIAAGTTLAAGEAAIEAEAVDSMTGERLFAAVDRRVGTMAPDVRHFDKWNHVKDALDYWLERFANRMHKMREEANAAKAK